MKILLDEQRISAGVRQLAEQVTRDYGEQPLTIIGIMTGSVVLLADLIRQLAMPLRVGVVQTSSYRHGIERGELVVNSELMPDIRHRNVLLIDDIFDTGHTLDRITEMMRPFEPRTLRSAVLLRKQGRQQVSLTPDYVLFEIPDEFVIGYGLDYRDEYRNLPYIGVLEESDLRDPPS